MTVYDVSNQVTFDRVSQWLNELDTYSTKADIIKMLVGNKIDKVSKGQGSKLSAASAV